VAVIEAAPIEGSLNLVLLPS